MSEPWVALSENRYGWLVERYEQSGNVADEEQVKTRAEADKIADDWLEQGWPEEDDDVHP